MNTPTTGEVCAPATPYVSSPPTSPIPLLIPTDVPDVYEMHVDNTSKELFETCARAAEYYSVLRRIRAGDRPALYFGGVIHQALVPRKLFLTGEKFDAVTWEAEQAPVIVNAYENHEVGIDEWRTADRAYNAITLYNKVYPVDKEPFTYIKGTIEMPFKIKLGTADLASTVTTHAGTFYVKTVIIYWTGKIDALVDYGSIMVMDHKTTSVIGPTFYDDFVLSAQMHGYTWAARKLGYDVAGLLLDVLGLRKPSRTGTPTEFQRQRYFYSQELVDEWERDTFTLITDFLEHLCRGYFPKSPKWCFGKYGRCQYWDVCSSVPEQRASILKTNAFEHVTWSPLQ